MRNSISRYDVMGWVIEKGVFYFFWLITCLAVINQTFLLVFGKFGNKKVDELLVKGYDTLIEPNIGTITTTSAIFLGIYVSAVSIMGALKANSLMAMLDDFNLKKFVRFIIIAMISAFLVIFYSFFDVALKNKSVQSVIFIHLSIYMMLTALRFMVNVVIIYTHDLGHIKENIETEKEEKEKLQHIMYLLGKFLEEREETALKQRSEKMTEYLRKLNQEKPKSDG